MGNNNYPYSMNLWDRWKYLVYRFFCSHTSTHNTLAQGRCGRCGKEF